MSSGWIILENDKIRHENESLGKNLKMRKNGQKCLKNPENQQNGAQKKKTKPKFRFIPEDSHACKIS